MSQLNPKYTGLILLSDFILILSPHEIVGLPNCTLNSTRQFNSNKIVIIIIIIIMPAIAGAARTISNSCSTYLSKMLE
jgi:hypothetical protein